MVKGGERNEEERGGDRAKWDGERRGGETARKKKEIVLIDGTLIGVEEGIEVGLGPPHILAFLLTDIIEHLHVMS